MSDPPCVRAWSSNVRSHICMDSVWSDRSMWQKRPKTGDFGSDIWQHKPVSYKATLSQSISNKQWIFLDLWPFLIHGQAQCIRTGEAELKLVLQCHKLMSTELIRLSYLHKQSKQEFLMHIDASINVSGHAFFLSASRNAWSTYVIWMPQQYLSFNSRRDPNTSTKWLTAVQDANGISQFIEWQGLDYSLSSLSTNLGLPWLSWSFFRKWTLCYK